jgi:predicted amidohydrolase YtcJ
MTKYIAKGDIMKLYVNCNVISQDKSNNNYSELAVEGNKIVELGNGTLRNKFKEATVIDLAGKTIVPGFIEGHVHLLNYAYSLTKINCADVSSIKEMIDAGQKYIVDRKIPKGQWVQGRGWNQTFFAEKRNPTIHDLDAISRDHPIVFTRICEHMVVANSKAMELAGITKDSPNPIGGEIEKDANGNLTGLMKETARYIIYKLIPAKTVEEIKDMLVEAIKIASSYGLTTMHSDDFETFADKDWRKVLKAYRELEAEEKLNMRICEQCLLPQIDKLHEFIKAEVVNKKDTDMVKVGPLKLLTDGSLGGRSAFMLEAYKDAPETRGIAVFKQAELNELVAAAHKVKMGVVCHAIGDGAMTMVLDAFLNAQKVKPDNDARFGIIHLQITTKEILARFKTQNIVAYMEPVCLNSDLHIVESRVGKEKAMTSYNYRTLCDMGIHYTVSSDCPVDSLNPFDSMFVGTNRCDYKGYPKGGWNPKEKLTVLQMLKGFTIYGAYASFEEGKKGSLEKGKFADFVIISDDPTKVNTMDLRNIYVCETILGGKTVYRKN